VAVNNVHNFFNVRSKAIKLKNGQRLKLSVSANDLSTTKKFKEFAPETRNCKYSEENNANFLFKVLYLY